MNLTTENYLNTLFSFAPSYISEGCIQKDCLSLIHVPPEGNEVVYTLGMNRTMPLLTIAKYQVSVWKLIEEASTDIHIAKPDLEVFQTKLDEEHPVFDFISQDLVHQCQPFAGGRPGMDFFMLLSNLEGESQAKECWEPYGRIDQPWMTLIGALQTVSKSATTQVDSFDLVAV